MAVGILNKEEQLAFLERLTSLTDRGTITWRLIERTTDWERDDVFQTSVDKFVFALSSIDGDGVSPYQILIMRRGAEPDGKLESLDRIEMKPLDDGGSPRVNSLLGDLYENVARQTQGSDETVRELFDSLNRLAPKNDDPPS
jgi:hypothetical protein